MLSNASTLSFQIGANDLEVINVPTVSLGQVLSPMLGAGAFTPGMSGPLAAIDAAINAVSGVAGDFGAVQNRLEYTLNNLTNYEENLASANSRVKDVDMAFAASSLTKEQILRQSGVAMLSQAEQAPRAVLSLLTG